MCRISYLVYIHLTRPSDLMIYMLPYRSLRLPLMTNSTLKQTKKNGWYFLLFKSLFPCYFLTVGSELLLSEIPGIQPASPRNQPPGPPFTLPPASINCYASSTHHICACDGKNFWHLCKSKSMSI
jgi:hypothetical protein